MRNFGFSGMDQTDALGANAKMSEASAAMGLVNLESLTEFIDENFRNYQAYRRGLEGIPGVQMIEYKSNEKCNYHYVVLEIDDSQTVLSRDELKEILWAEERPRSPLLLSGLPPHGAVRLDHAKCRRPTASYRAPGPARTRAADGDSG